VGKLGGREDDGIGRETDEKEKVENLIEEEYKEYENIIDKNMEKTDSKEKQKGK
jgi:hypothetical protein